MQALKEDPSFQALLTDLGLRIKRVRHGQFLNAAFLAFNCGMLPIVALRWWAYYPEYLWLTGFSLFTHAGLIVYHFRMRRWWRNHIAHLQNAVRSLNAAANTFSYTAADHHLDQALAALHASC